MDGRTEQSTEKNILNVKKKCTAVLTTRALGKNMIKVCLSCVVNSEQHETPFWSGNPEKASYQE